MQAAPTTKEASQKPHTQRKQGASGIVVQPKQQQQLTAGPPITRTAKRGNTKRGDGHNDNIKDRDDDQSCSSASSRDNDNMDENGGETDNVV